MPFSQWGPHYRRREESNRQKWTKNKKNKQHSASYAHASSAAELAFVIHCLNAVVLAPSVKHVHWAGKENRDAKLSRWAFSKDSNQSENPQSDKSLSFSVWKRVGPFTINRVPIVFLASAHRFLSIFNDVIIMPTKDKHTTSINFSIKFDIFQHLTKVG